MMAQSHTIATVRFSRSGGWLPRDPHRLNSWLRRALDEAASKKATTPSRPVIEKFRKLIENDPIVFMYFDQMFKEQRAAAPPPGSGDVKIEDYEQMLDVMDYVLGTAPEYNTTEMVGFPINAILDFPMITRAGLAAFASDKINAMFREVLSEWTKFLDGPDSRSVLNDTPTGWLSTDAKKAVNLDEFVTDPSDPYYGFKSWNDFFIREFKPGMRSVASPDDDRVIVSACESQPFAIDTNAQRRSTFWIKEQPYSLEHMLSGHHASDFIGGTVYQAFLSAENYHRWHSPVSGTIREIHQVPGTYYAEAASEGFDEAGPNNSQGYIAHVATRAIIFIEADRAEIGLIAVIPIGMAEVSSCRVTVREGQHITKGDQIGYFQFGGSTHCVVFRKGVIAQFSSQAIPQGPEGSNSPVVRVNSYLATSS